MSFGKSYKIHTTPATTTAVPPTLIKLSVQKTIITKPDYPTNVLQHWFLTFRHIVGALGEADAISSPIISFDINRRSIKYIKAEIGVRLH